MRRSVLLLTFAVTFSAQADVKVWTNSHSGLWSTSANWSPNGAPANDDSVLITNDGTYTVTLDVNSAIAGLVLGGGTGTQTLATAWQELELNGVGRVALSGHFLLSGTLAGTNVLFLEGRISWRGGTVDANSNVKVEATGELFVGDGANHARIVLGSLTNEGTIIYAAPGILGLAGPLHNLPGGVFDIRWNQNVFYSGPDGVFINDGKLLRSAGANNAGCDAPVINSGTVETQTGTLTLADGSVFNDGSRFLGAGITKLVSGTNLLNGALYSENLLLGGANLAGTASLAGTVTWGAGAIEYGASLLVATNGQLVIGGGANYARTLRGRLDNAGIILYEAPGPLALAGPLHNLESGLFDIRWNYGILNSGPEGLFVNDGTFRKSAGIGTTECQVPLINSGTVETQTGTLTLADGSVFNDGSRFLGAGITKLVSGTNLLNGALYSENLLLGGANLAGTASLAGTVTWGAGAIEHGASLLVATNGQLVIGGGANYARTLRGRLDNAGIILYEAPGPLMSAGPLHNLEGGLFDIRWDHGILNIGPEGSFINAGTFRKSAGIGTTECQIPFVNLGTVEVLSGRLSFANTYNQPKGNILMRDGKFRSDQTLVLAGGRLTGWGTMETHLINAGATVSPGTSNGVITISGNYTQKIGGSVEFLLSGASPGTNPSFLKVTGSAELGGTLSVKLLQAYLPEPGASNTVMSFTSYTGDFVRRNGCILLGHDRRLVTTYSPKTLSLIAIPEPDPSSVSLQIGSDGQDALISWPIESGPGTLYACTNLLTSEWAIVPTFENSFLERPMVPYKWFRLSIP